MEDDKETLYETPINLTQKTNKEAQKREKI
jgi:hypothetical protein